MKIRQLLYVCEIARLGYNISAAAKSLHTAQPGISKQLKLLEDELGARLFYRKGNRLSGLTSTGEKILDSARRIVREADYIRQISRPADEENAAVMTIATTHTQARYVLPALLKRFKDRYPKVSVTLRHAKPEGIHHFVAHGDVDLGVTTNAPEQEKDLLILPCLKFDRAIIVPSGHALLRARAVTLKALARYPLITYDSGFSGREEVMVTFQRAKLEPQIVISASDADVIKSCVEQGLGIAVLLGVVYDEQRDTGLKAIPAPFFPQAQISVIVHRRHYLRAFEYDFIEMLSAHWHRSNVQRVSSRAINKAEPKK